MVGEGKGGGMRHGVVRGEAWWDEAWRGEGDGSGVRVRTERLRFHHQQ